MTGQGSVEGALREVSVDRLMVGMYVAELDRPWLETPFPLQGFYVRTARDIREVAAVCGHVKVDPRRFDPRLAETESAASAQSRRPVTRDDADADSQRNRNGQAAGLPSARVCYEDVNQVEDELPEARVAFESSARTFQDFWQNLSERRRVSLGELRGAVDPLVESILRNKDALVTLMRVQHLDRNTHEHCMALAVWGSLLGRQLGLSPDDIKILALGCSLVDVGKIRLPKQVLYKPGVLTTGEFQIIQSHVDYSQQIIEQMGEVPERVMSIVRWHHERMDGSGYPDGLEGHVIPMFARIAGIVDSYDAMICPRIYAPTCSSYEALVELQDHCPAHFQTELVEQFAQAIGLFPNGALVELFSGEVGVVCGQNAGRRLRPKVMIILGADKRPRAELHIIDLKSVSEQDVRISRELAKNEYGIDAREYFL